MKRDMIFAVYAPPSVGFPYLGVAVDATYGDLTVEAFKTAAEADAFVRDFAERLEQLLPVHEGG
jgi:hypothetical protein